jgi:hypothetical protein
MYLYSQFGRTGRPKVSMSNNAYNIPIHHITSSLDPFPPCDSL